MNELAMAILLLLFAGFFATLGWKLNRAVVVFGALLFLIRSAFFLAMFLNWLGDLSVRVTLSRNIELLIYIWTAIVVTNGHINDLLTWLKNKWTTLNKHSLHSWF